jgi:tetratricopeptide (TPR) repeat protein/energy-coupling factor transporter ATP-binding protein EcfA2
MIPHSAQALSAERPFPGLRPFDFDDFAFFFGRSDQIASLYRLLDRNRFVAVVGSSGCGKSSLTRAGLLHVLHQENTEGRPAQWAWRIMRPGDAPIEALAEALSSLAEDSDEATAKIRRERVAFQLNRSNFGFVEALGETELPEAHKFVLVVDQFEELFRYSERQIGQVQDRLHEARARDQAESFVALLLEARRSSRRDIRILITMRSDFIGDCARFPGLPEAVSATQFLVPGMIRDQYEAVIRKPIAKAHATIDPELVEQLLNDADDELDQLPVLQHCLLQLWERAGAKEQGDASGAAELVSARPEAASPAGRHIDLDDYRQIGKIAGALSQHADHILREYREQAVEAVFRALSELKDGRAIRRAIPFQQLREECGLPQDELEHIVDRFRADDCSFLVTSPPGVAKLTDDTVIDVGHEALLRRWERSSGAPGATGDGGDKLPIGWLRQERKDGQKYQILLSMLEGNDASRKVEDIKRHWIWWNERVRTPRWAERYGGKYDAVEKLLRDGWAHRRNVHIRDWSLAVIGALIVLWAGYSVYQKNLETEVAQQDARVKQQLADANFARSVSIATAFLDQVLSALNRGQIQILTARAMEKSAQSIVDELRNVNPSASTIELEVRLNVVAADILNDAGAFPDALDRAEKAQSLAEQLSRSHSDNDEFQTLLLNSDLRVGDAFEAKKDYKNAALQFDEARSIARKLADSKPEDDDRQSKLAFAIGKVGQTARDQEQYEEALSEYVRAMEVATNIAAKHPDDPEPQALVPSLLSKIADMRTKLAKPDIAQALGEYQAAIEKQETLLNRFPGDVVIRSNLALSHRGRAEAFIKAGNWDGAFGEFKSAIAIRDKLVDDYRDNANQIGYLAADHAAFADALLGHNQAVFTVAATDTPLESVLSELRLELRARKMLVDIDPKNQHRNEEMAVTQRKIDDVEAQIPAATK